MPADDISTLFEPLALGRITLGNRLAVAPMTRISATADGCATARMLDYYQAFAKGGFGLVISEGIYTDQAYSQGYLYQPGLSDAAQRDAWVPVVQAVQGAGGRMIAQLMHAGALSQGNRFRSESIGPSAVQPAGQQMAFYRGTGAYPMPRAMTQADIASTIEGFADAARRAREAGFDGVEIHGANGYLLDQFLAEGVNERDDRYGGSVERRLQLLVEVVAAVRRAVGGDYTVGVRISQGKVNDFPYKWKGGERDAVAIFSKLGKLALDYVHTTEFEAWRSAFGNSPSLAALARAHAGLSVIANGSLHEPQRAADMIVRGETDMIALGRGALSHADWPQRVRRGLPLARFDGTILAPLADLANADRRRRELSLVSK